MADDDESTPAGHHSHGGRPHSHGVKREDTHGARTLEALANISQTKQGEKVKRSLELGLEAADSINDRTISLFSRGHQPAFAGIPFDSATTYRSGAALGRRRCAGSPLSMTATGLTAASICMRNSICATPETFL